MVSTLSFSLSLILCHHHHVQLHPSYYLEDNRFPFRLKAQVLKEASSSSGACAFLSSLCFFPRSVTSVGHCLSTDISHLLRQTHLFS